MASLLLGGCGPLGSGCGSTGLEEGDCAPDFVLDDADGRPVQLSSLRGEPVLVMGASVWCTSCRDLVVALQGWLDADAPDVRILNVLVEDVDGQPADRADAVLWRDTYGLGFDVLPDPEGIWVEEWGDHDGLDWVQHSYTLVDADGRVAWHHNGFDDGALRLIDVRAAFEALD